MTPNMDPSEDQVLNYTEAPPTRRNSGMFDSPHERKQKVRVRTIFTAEDWHTRASPAVSNRQFDHQKDKNGKTPKTANTRIKQREAGDEKEEGQRGPTGVGNNTSVGKQVGKNASATTERPASSAAHAGTLRLKTRIQSWSSHQSL